MPIPVSSSLDELELELNYCGGVTLGGSDQARMCHRFLFAPAFRAESVLEFELGVADPSVLLIVPPKSSATARLSGFEVIEPLPPDHLRQLTEAFEELCPQELPDVSTNSRDGIAVRYRLEAHGESRGFDAFNPDIELDGKHCKWIEIALSVAAHVLTEDKTQQYLAELQCHFVIPER